MMDRNQHPTQRSNDSAEVLALSSAFSPSESESFRSQADLLLYSLGEASGNKTRVMEITRELLEAVFSNAPQSKLQDTRAALEMTAARLCSMWTRLEKEYDSNQPPSFNFDPVASERGIMTLSFRENEEKQRLKFIAYEVGCEFQRMVEHVPELNSAFLSIYYSPSQIITTSTRSQNSRFHLGAFVHAQHFNQKEDALFLVEDDILFKHYDQITDSIVPTVESEVFTAQHERNPHTIPQPLLRQPEKISYSMHYHFFIDELTDAMGNTGVENPVDVLRGHLTRYTSPLRIEDRLHFTSPGFRELTLVAEMCNVWKPYDPEGK